MTLHHTSYLVQRKTFPRHIPLFDQDQNVFTNVFTNVFEDYFLQLKTLGILLF